MRLFGKKRPDVWKLKREGNVSGLIEVLSNRDLEEADRVSAADRLGELNELTAVDALSIALVDDVTPVKWAAARALHKIDGARVEIEILTTALNDPESEWSRSFAVEALGKSHDQRAFEPLVAALGFNPDPRIRRHAVSALAELGDPRAVDALSGALESEDYVIRQHAVQKLIQLNATSVVERLVTFLTDDAVRKGVEESLLYPGEQAREGFAPVFAALRESVHTQQTPGEVPAAAVSAAARPSSVSVGQTWRDAGGNDYLVVSATQGVSYRLQFVSGTEKPGWSLGSQISIYEPGELLDDASWSFVSSPSESAGVFDACKAGDAGSVRELLERDAGLANTREAGGITPLHVAATEGHGVVVSLLLDNGADVDTRNDYGVTPLYLAAAWGHTDVVRRLLAAGADQAIADEKGESPLAAARRKGHEDLAALLQDVGTDKSTERTTRGEMDVDKLEKSQDVEGLIAALRAADVDNRRAAARALGQLRDVRAFQPLVEVFVSPDEDQGVRQVSALALGWLGDERAVETLIDVLQRPDDNGEVRRFAADAIGELGNPRAVEPLISLVQKSDDSFVKQLAGVALGKLGDRRAVDALTDALRSGVHVAEALGRLGDKRAVEPLLEVATRSEYHIGLRHSAVNALGDLGDSGAIEGLRSLLTDDGFSAYHTTVRGALEKLGALAKPERPEDLIGAASERALALKAEYREAALEWWRGNQRSDAICDDCNVSIPRPEGYLRPGYLACERCTDKMVSGYYS